MIVCLCRAVCERVLDDAIAAGASSVEAVRRVCGAGGDCGACLPMIADWIEQQAAERYPRATV